jgi:hypothetical protein
MRIIAPLLIGLLLLTGCRPQPKEDIRIKSAAALLLIMNDDGTMRKEKYEAEIEYVRYLLEKSDGR